MRYARTLSALLMLLLVTGCVLLPATPTPGRVLNVGMILGSGGLGDRSFNDSAYAGLQEAQRRFDIRFETIDHTSDEANLDELRRLIELGYDLIIGIGYENAPYIKELAPEFPGRKFAVVDTVGLGGRERHGGGYPRGEPGQAVRAPLYH